MTSAKHEEPGAFDAAALLDFRWRKDEHFASGRGPIEGDALRNFPGLSYYPPAPEWALTLPVTPGSGAEITLETNTGELRQMAHFGTATLDLPDGQAALGLYAPLGDEAPERVFVPFRDATSGNETYGAGRYLDAPLSRTPQGLTVRLDFNLAYHPYCAYAERWTCPLPPRGNTLNVAVRAGERLPEG